MENTKVSLTTEVIKFLEICQSAFIKGQIDVEIYTSYAEVKLKFIKQFLNIEDRNENKDLFVRIIKLFNVHECILMKKTVSIL